LVKRRFAREPVARILGYREFYSRDFEVTRDVLVPRPETEHLVDAVLEWTRERDLSVPSIADIGTGSGCIAVTLACELPEARVVATDVSEEALDVAHRNARAHDVEARVELVRGDLYTAVDQPTRRRFDVVVSNPPYVDAAVREILQPEVRDWEPEVALFASAGGLEILRRLCAGAHAHLAAPGLFACEIAYDQKSAVLDMLKGAGRWQRLEVLADLQGHPRIAVAERGDRT
jgi:release factor glutamine methyltransferase